EEIRKTLETFFDGLRTLDYDKISETFYGEGLSIGVSRDQGQISHVLREHWKEMGERERAKGEDFSHTTVHWKIKSLNIIGNAASAIVDLAFGTISKAGEKIIERYIDFYHLLKTSDKWIIVNKIYPTNIDVKSKQEMDKWPIITRKL
ncbi:MAG: nuclear transport factor 2 family protein, partial [Candidatus Bathyarchaeota archaeon]